MGKLNQAAKPSKLSSEKQKEAIASKSNVTPMGFSTPDKASVKPTSVRLTADDKAIFTRIVRDINGVSKTKMSESDTIRAIVRFSENIPIERIFKAYKAGM